MDYLKSKNLQFIKLLGKGSFSEVRMNLFYHY